MARFLPVALGFLLTLGGLMPVAALANGGVLSAPDTGISGSFTGQLVISSDAHHVLLGHIISARRGNEVHHALIVQQRRDGVHRLSYSSAQAGVTALPFRRLRATGCSHGHCRDRPIGFVALSTGMMTQFAQTGLRFQLVGRSGTIGVAVPPRLFAEALMRADALGLTPG